MPKQEPVRHDFSKIRSYMALPNLIDVQRKSYERFLQMNLLPEEREDTGLQSVFTSVFPFSDFRETCSLDFVKFSIGNWECKCGQLKGLEHLRMTCANCGSKIITDHPHEETVSCQKCGVINKNRVEICDICGNPVDLQMKYSVEECQERGMSYSVPLKVTFRLFVYDKDPDTGVKHMRDAKEEEVFFGDIPLMTDNGTFIINGTERVIVSQLHRSPGVFFTKESAHTFLAKIIPYRGSWVEFEYDQKNILYVRIDRKRKFLGSVFLRALGLTTDEEILRQFYTPIKAKITKSGENVELSFDKRVLDQEEAKERHSIRGRRTVRTVFAGIKLDQKMADALTKNNEASAKVDFAAMDKAVFLGDVVDFATGEVLFEAGESLPADWADTLREHDIAEVDVIFPEWDLVSDILLNTVRKDTSKSFEQAIIEIYRRMRPGDPPTLESAKALFEGMFFDARKYDFSRVGRFKFNIKLDLQSPVTQKTMSAEDFFVVINYLLRLRKDVGRVDDIDNLGNRRVRAVGELLENQFRIGLVRMERAIKEKMSVHQDIDSAMPHDLINSKPVIAAIKEFFGSSQLSQFMDQTNPLSEVTHKRRLSALGPGGLSRERAGFEVRDVHPTHYGRICPIETPEGPNIGLISSLACYARINEYGFIESPYKKVEGGRVLDHYRIVKVGDSSFTLGQVVEKRDLQKENTRIAKENTGKNRKAMLQLSEAEPYAFYLSAWDEERYTIAQANVVIDEEGNLVHDRVIARQAGEFVSIEREKVDFIDVSPKQLVSVAASLVPFLENDDANRALMGANMQRQSVPLLRTDSPLVGTGMENIVARDSGAVILCKRGGVVDLVDSNRIIVRVEAEDQETGETKEFGADIYQLIKFKRSNQNTCITQKPVVREGQRVRKGQVLADGPCTDAGELALGRNILVAFMPWRGTNFEDAILVSEKLVKEDYYTSIHIEEFEIEARDTKLGPEEITRDIPNVSESALRDLDESGIVRIGATVKQGDILVGKVTPKGETQLTPEEKLLRAIFGEKAGDVRDASLKTPPGIEGTVVDVKIFSRKGVEKDLRAKAIEDSQVEQMNRNIQDEIRIITDARNKRIAEALADSKLQRDVVDFKTGDTLVKKGETATRDTINKLSRRELLALPVDEEIRETIRMFVERAENRVRVLEQKAEERREDLQKGDELPPGVIKMIKVYVAMKRKLSVGDKMAGRHGNKGVISRILPEEDMPYLPDGTPVEIVLNPLGVPSRMNVGQILETHLGWAARSLGLYFSTPVFDGAMESEIKAQLKAAGLPEDGKTDLFDGMTGEKFEQKVCVGFIYMLKLSHLVDDKIHARSIGPYSLITQQPLGGKA
ncbi:MAG TPA: DNA-directed RNA polymerase subunit beta, partial [Thermoanaerobaculia bacterium]|nr:DNA-directed RNA polymerase subunit beta [Thermoanaerobaculia bacterium]